MLHQRRCEGHRSGRPCKHASCEALRVRRFFLVSQSCPLIYTPKKCVKEGTNLRGECGTAVRDLGGIWSLADAKGLGKLSLDGHKDAVESVTISADNRYLVTTSQDNTTIVWPMLSLEATDLGEVKPVATLIGHRDDVAGAAISSSSAPSADPLVVITVISYLSYLLLYLDKIRLLGFTTLHDSRRYAIPPYLIPNLSLLSDKIR